MTMGQMTIMTGTTTTTTKIPEEDDEEEEAATITSSSRRRRSINASSPCSFFRWKNACSPPLLLVLLALTLVLVISTEGTVVASTRVGGVRWRLLRQGTTATTTSSETGTKTVAETIPVTATTQGEVGIISIRDKREHDPIHRDDASDDEDVEGFTMMQQPGFIQEQEHEHERWMDTLSADIVTTENSVEEFVEATESTTRQQRQRRQRRQERRHRDLVSSQQSCMKECRSEKKQKNQTCQKLSDYIYQSICQLNTQNAMLRGMDTCKIESTRNADLKRCKQSCIARIKYPCLLNCQQRTTRNKFELYFRSKCRVDCQAANRSRLNSCFDACETAKGNRKNPPPKKTPRPTKKKTKKPKTHAPTVTAAPSEGMDATGGENTGGHEDHNRILKAAVHETETAAAVSSRSSSWEEEERYIAREMMGDDGRDDPGDEDDENENEVDNQFYEELMKS